MREFPPRTPEYRSRGAVPAIAATGRVTLRGMNRPEEPISSGIPAARAVAILFSPLVLSWGLGAAHPWLDRLAVPAAALSSIPAWSGLPGLAVAIAAGWLLRRRPDLLLPILLVPGLAALAALASVARPLPWVAAVLALALTFLRAPIPPASGRGLSFAFPVLWAAAALLRPFGGGLPARLQDPVASVLGEWPLFASTLAALVAAPLLLLPGERRPRWLAAGAGLGVLLVLTFGNQQGLVGAAVFGAAAAHAAPHLRRLSLEALLVALLLCFAGSARLALTERWRCGDVDDEAAVTRLLDVRDVTSLALSAGNLAYLGLLADDELRRMTVTGALGDAAPLDPPGGRLLDPLTPGAPVVRVVPDGAETLVEWWDLPRLAVASSARVPCVAEGALVADAGGAVVVACDEAAWRVAPGVAPTALELDGVPREALRAGLLTLSPGPLATATAWVDPPTSAFLGPFAPDVTAIPGGFLVARGAAGQVEVRGTPPAIPTVYAPPEGPAWLAEALRRRLDGARVGVWPGEVGWSPVQEAAWVASPVDATLTLVDPEVTWHQVAVSIGAPARSVVLEPGSGRFYVANRCGVFGVKLPTTSPW